MTFLLSITVCAAGNFLITDNNIYRLLFIRYVFLVVPACLLIKSINRFVVVILSLASILYLLLYHNTNFEPWVDETWDPQQWPAYFYTMIIFILFCKFYHLDNLTWIKKRIVVMGKMSYEFFLAQMFVLNFFDFNNFDSILHRIVHNTCVSFLTWAVVVFLLCTIIALVLRYIEEKLQLIRSRNE